MKKSLYFSFFAILLVAFFYCLNSFRLSNSSNLPLNNFEQDSFSNIVKSWVIKVCYVPWPPSITKDPNSWKLSWFWIDIMESIAKDSELKAEYIETTWWWFSADLNSKKCDMWLDFYPLLNRAKTISFSKPFYYIWNNVVVKSSSNYKSLSELNDKNIKIAVIQWEFWHLYAKKYLSNTNLVVLDASSDNTAPILAVLAWQADAWMIMDDTISEFIKNNSTLKKLNEKPYSTTPNSFWVRTVDKNLLLFLNTAIDMLEANWDFELLAKKYNSYWFVKKTDYIPLSK